MAQYSQMFLVQSYVGSGNAVTVWFIYIICFREEGEAYFEEAVTAP